MKPYFFFAALAIATSLPAADIYWTGAASGDDSWSAPQNWNGNVVPGDGDRARFDNDYTVQVDGDVRVGSISVSDGKSPVFQGSGSLTVVNGSVTGGKGAKYNVPVIFPEGVAATASSANQYGSSVYFNAGLSGGASVSTGGSQNYGFRATNGVVSVPSVKINCGASLGASFTGDSLIFTDTWADSNGNSPTMTFLPGFTAGAETAFTTAIGVPTLQFTNEGAGEPVLFTVPSLRVGAGGRPTLTCTFYGGTNLVSIGSFVREPGSLLRISNNKKSGTFTPGENAGFIVPGMPVDAQGLCPAWVYSDSYRVRKLANNALAPLTVNDYTAVGGTLSLTAPTGLYRLNQSVNTLAADSDIDSLLFQQDGNTTTQRFDLGDHDLVVHGGSVATRDKASKILASTGGGRLVFASDALVLNLPGEAPRLELSAPIAWQKPEGSETQYPDFLIPTYAGAEFAISGEDQVRDWGGFFAEGRGKGLQAFSFEGPSDRTFHGTVGGRFILHKRGPGTLTFAGPSRTRGHQIHVFEGMVSIAHDDAPAITCVTNGGVARVEAGIAWSNTVKVYKDGILEGSGTLTQKHDHNNLFDGCVLRGGTTDVPGTLSFGGQVTFPTNLVLDVGFAGDVHGQISVAGKQTFRKDLDTVVRVRVSAAVGTAVIRPEDVFTVHSWRGGTENYNASRVSFVVENATPERLDTSSAAVTLNTSAKTISVTGIRSRTKAGTVLILRGGSAANPGSGEGGDDEEDGDEGEDGEESGDGDGTGGGGETGGESGTGGGGETGGESGDVGEGETDPVEHVNLIPENKRDAVIPFKGAGQLGMVYTAVFFPADTEALVFTCEIRTEGVVAGEQSWNNARFMSDFIDSNSKKLESGPAFGGWTGTRDWTTVRKVITVPAGVAGIALMPSLFNVQAGAFEVRNMCLEPISGIDAALDGVPRSETLPVKAAWTTATLHVSGNRLVDAAGDEVWLQGVAVPSLEWSPGGEHIMQSVTNLVEEWNVNVVRLAVHSSYWFGRGSGQNKNTGIATYRGLVDQVADYLQSRGKYMVLDLHEYLAPTASHAAFWLDAATRYKNHPGVIFGLLNEPHDISWEIWRNGGVVSDDGSGVGDRTVGMQGLVDAVRSTGATNLVTAGGLDWGYTHSGVLNGYALDDANLMYESHVYPWKSGWKRAFLDVAERYPVLLGEVGAQDTPMSFETEESFIPPEEWVPDILGVIQARRLNWTAWCFHPKSSPCMITGWDYTPTTYWGEPAKRALAGESFPEPARLR